MAATRHTAAMQTRPHQSTLANVGNALLVVAVAVPAVVSTRLLFASCGAPVADAHDSTWASLADAWNTWQASNDCPGCHLKLACTLSMLHPLVWVNIVFFLNCCVLFWMVSLVQRSTWLIDPYWTIIPPMIEMFFRAHPRGAALHTRSVMAAGLVWVWSLRLTHSYFRREEWQFGGREDWRFTQMRKQYGWNWAWISFFAAFLSQQFMLVGLCLPFYAIHFGAAASTPWGALDVVGATAAAMGVCLGYFADTQLRDFMVWNHARAAAGQPKVQILNTGVWRYSRHPNYVGEQLWWWGLALLGVQSGVWWVVVGPAFNSMVMASVTVMTERRMGARPERAKAWREYAEVTPAWVPIPTPWSACMHSRSGRRHKRED